MFENRKIKLLSIFFSLVSCPLVLGTTSCSTSLVDEKYKINIDVGGKLVNELTYKDAIKAALSNPTSYQDFKSTLADEVVLKWFKNKMAGSSGQSGNVSFRDQYDEMIATINRDYDKIIQECRDKYGANYHFYLQNEYLTPNGGTEESYKHNQLLAKVKEFFQKQVFEKSYFGFKVNKEVDMPVIQSDVVSSISKSVLDNPDNWDRIGFFAKTDDSFKPPKANDECLEYIKKNPAGDYATLQNYVFDRWFATEQPFFTAASLFKYSNPKDLGDKPGDYKVDDIYKIRENVPETPTEAFPFFGPIDITKERKKGTSGFYQWYQELLKTGFLTGYTDDKNVKHESNGTISIDRKFTEDSQTLLLCVGSTNYQDLVAPYAIGDGSLYSQMFGYCDAEDVNNQLTQDELVTPTSEDWTNEVQSNNTFILKNFIYTTEEAVQKDGSVKSKLKVRPETIKSYIDLKKLYVDNTQNTTKTHNYDIFKNNKDFTDFYGKEGEQYGARYVTNNFQVDLTKTDAEENLSQPWYFVLNQFGLHILTIDGYEAIKKQKTLNDKQHVAKNILKYRLLQHKNNIKNDIFGPTNVFDSGTRLDVYFKKHYANIILEMALGTWTSGNTTNNIFCSNFGSSLGNEGTNYLNELWSENNFYTYPSFCDYLNETIIIDWYKKALGHYKDANTSIYNYKNDAVSNSKHVVNWDKTKYANGILGPIGFKYSVMENGYDYCDNKLVACTIPYDSNFKGLLDKSDKPQPLQYSELSEKIMALQNHAFIKNIDKVPVNSDEDGFSPQTINAKNAGSNSFWYKSPLVTKFMQSTKVSSYILNRIYNDTYNDFFTNINFDQNNNIWKELTGDVLTSKYLASKVLTNENNYSCLVKNAGDREEYINNITDAWNTKQNMQIINNYTLNNDDIVALNKVKATLAWLMSTTDDKNQDYLKNFYNILSNKINANKIAYIGYLAKVHDLLYSEYDQEERYTDNQNKKIIYDWQSEVGNIYDQHNYHGIGYHDEQPLKEQTDVDSEYWTSVINKNVDDGITKQWTGFTGLLTEIDPGIISDNSDLKIALFEELAEHTCNSSLYLVSNKNQKIRNNQGIWFAYSSETDENGKPITFNIETKDEKIDETKFAKTPKVLGLAKTIANMSSKESLRLFINDLIKKYYNSECPFKVILDNDTKSLISLDDLKIALLNALPTDPTTTQTNGIIDYNCFERLTNIQLHSNKGENNLNYSFINNENGDGYKMIITQINHEDVIKKTLHPRSATVDGEINRNEFYSLMISLAMDESIQKIALTEMIKVCYHGDKLQVYDAIIYNLLNGTWVKDWNRKTYNK